MDSLAAAREARRAAREDAYIDFEVWSVAGGELKQYLGRRRSDRSVPVAEAEDRAGLGSSRLSCKSS